MVPMLTASRFHQAACGKCGCSRFRAQSPATAALGLADAFAIAGRACSGLAEIGRALVRENPGLIAVCARWE